MSLIDSFLGAEDHEPQTPGGEIGWVAAGATLFAFAAPSAVQSAPFFIGGTGVVGGCLICSINTLGVLAGSWMLLQLKLKFPLASNMGELGYEAYGRQGQMWGNIFQLSNFVLFLPCGLLFTGQALAGVGKGISAFTQSSGAPCWDYYIFLVAFICFMTTQARTLSKTAIFSAISVFSVLIMAMTQIIAALSYDVIDKEPVQMFGNPDQHSLIWFMRSASICVFGFVPSFLTAELASCMSDPQSMKKALILSGVLNVVMMLTVGWVVTSCWGYNVAYVAPLTGQLPGTAKVAAWTPGNAVSSVLNLFALVGNFVSYMLDSVPLGRFCQKTWAPNFRDTWSAADACRYMWYTLPVFLFGVVLAVFFPSLDFLINVVTVVTTPWVTMVYPAVCYFKVFQAQMPPLNKLLTCLVCLLGLLSVLVSGIACIGNLVLTGTSQWQIGCTGWMILAPRD